MQTQPNAVVPDAAAGPSEESHSTASIVVTDQDVDKHCRDHNDKNRMHQTTPRVVPGLLLLNKVSGLVENMNLVDGLPMFREIRLWKWQRPVYGGESVYARFEVAGRRKAAGVELIVLKLKVYNQQNQVVARGEWEMSVIPAPN